jgi:hypothetical protein
MRVATPYLGVEPCAGPQTDVMGFPRVVVECLLALAQHTRGWTAIEMVNLHEVGKAEASEPPRALHADGPADAGLEGLRGLRQAVGTHEAPFALGRPSRTARHQHVHVVIHLAEPANRQTKDGAELKQTSLDRTTRCYLFGLYRTRQVYNLGNGRAPVHHDPVDGIVTNHEK